jgi:hypothetical protein
MIRKLGGERGQWTLWTLPHEGGVGIPASRRERVKYNLFFHHCMELLNTQ